MSAGVDLSDMRRLLVIGPPGAGKSTLANRIASKVNLDVVHLDRLLWQPGWIQRDRAKFDTLLVEALNPSGWIIEGNHVGTLPKRLARADTVIWLDLPRLVCLARVLWRTLRHYRRTRPDMTPGCPERFDLEFFRYIWSFQAAERPRIIAAIETYGAHCHLVHLTTPRETDRYLASLP